MTTYNVQAEAEWTPWTLLDRPRGIRNLAMERIREYQKHEKRAS